MKTKKGELWEAPVHWGTDDWPPFAQYEAGGFWMGIWHPFLTGRLARWKQVEKWLEDTLRKKKVWFAPLEDIIAHVKKLSETGEYEPRTEQLPYYTKSQAKR